MYKIIVHLSPLLLSLALWGCDRMNIESIHRSKTMSLSDNVHLHRTGGSNVSITDKDGVGIVYGNVKRIGRGDQASQYVLIAFEPFPHDEAAVANSGLKLVRVHLESAEVAELADSDERQIQSLENINAFFPRGRGQPSN